MTAIMIRLARASAGELDFTLGWARGSSACSNIVEKNNLYRDPAWIFKETSRRFTVEHGQKFLF
jgi:hypothetical protein